MRTLKTLLTWLAALSLLFLEETKQAQQNLDVQNRSRLGRPKKVCIDKSTICETQLATP